jgi:hypothetical protein
VRTSENSVKTKFAQQVFWVLGYIKRLREHEDCSGATCAASVSAWRYTHRFTATTVTVSAFVGGVRTSKAFQVSMPGEGALTFDCFECAIHALAPTCEYCSVKVIGHGIEADGSFYCCAHCASMAGAAGVADRA